ncbi:hypothetical protein EUGRSUZ_F02245 [Eucalyptus grandis]|uniref:Uncharacterized protein n=2 Tax=Eucalyptus grandis TaxID=71139 RepID=A0ACC3KGV1_EUCGR|nr:hypothetical protein EUGRSUZ_F02245 [Eucalyptus grandis]
MSFAELQARHLFLGIALALCFNQVSSTTNETDRLALLAFKAGISGDPFGVLNSWNNSIGFCQWHGVTCDRRHQRVTVLNLQSQRLSGSISPHIGNLSFLGELLLQNNSFNQEIPPQLGQLHRLHILQLHNNSLVGEIPKNMSGCSNLVVLWLVNNKLSGEIPEELGSMLKLQEFGLGGNNLTGSMPSFIGNFSSLKELYLTQNNLGGSIPQVLGHLTNLQVIDIASNILSGTIPSSLLNLSSLVVFEAEENQIEGTLPAAIGLKLPNLESFSISLNQLEGQFLRRKVPFLEKLYKLSRFLVGYNQLGSGKPEDLSFLCSLTNSTKLEFVGGGYNKFGGVLPKCIRNLSTTLTVFALRKNQISSEIPKEMGNFIKLRYLLMGYNRLSGVIPSNLDTLQDVGMLQLNDNNLGGTIPSSLGNLTKLISLYLAGNHFHGQIPSHLSNCQSLNLLDLSDNNLSGTIPPQLIGLSSLAIILNLSWNHLTGDLPIEVGNLRALTALDISNNLLEGEIPIDLGDCTALTSMRMGGNLFHGSIPQSIVSLRGIEELDLSCNNLSGQIPAFLAEFRFLKLLNLSYNNFEGMLPREGVFKNVTGASIIGNNKLCGGLPEFHLPNCISKSSKSRERNIVILSASIIFGVFGIAFIYLCWSKKKVNEPISNSRNDSHPNMSYGALLKATDGFSSTNLIGVGSFGSVYRGIPEDNGIVVAVKVLHLVHHGALKSFFVECEAFKNIRHRNLLKILGVCSGSDYQGNDFKALVYQFMENGSLERWLHPNAASSLGNNLPRNLNFIQRINIAIDVAFALDYLHHQCHIPIVHCDLKPSNILLDAEMVAHVGDFGLMKFILGSSIDTVANQMSSMGLRGTIGYAPPEYAMGCKVSREGDIYSYGILLLEMFTGASPTDDIFRDNLTLHNFVAKALPGRVLEITDSVLLQERESHLGLYSPQHWLFESDDIYRDCLVMLYNIGIACSYSVPERRMRISGITNQLQQIREKLFALGLYGEDELPTELLS